jgi:hypothetical protein
MMTVYLGLFSVHPRDTVTKFLASCVFYLCLLELCFAITVTFHVTAVGNTKLEMGHCRYIT